MGRRIHFLHHIPGRLRVEIEGLKGNRRLADDIARQVGRVEGMERVQVNVLTGTVVVHYSCKDPASVARLQSLASDAEAMLDALAGSSIARPAAMHACLARFEGKGAV